MEARRAAYRNARLIYNPNAGSLIRRPHLAARVEAILREGGVAVSLTPTARPGHATELAAAGVQEGADLVISMGGDGTINEVLNGMVGSAVPLAVIPGGTANVFCCETGIPRNAEKAARLLAEWVPARVAVGRLQATGEARPRYFLLMAGAGFDASIVQKVEPGIKRRLGKLAYWLAGFRTFGRTLAMLRVRVPGADELETGFALIARVANYGGELTIASQASLHRDAFELVTFAGGSTLPYLFYLSGAVIGQATRLPGVRSQFVQQLELAPRNGGPVYLQADGEFAGQLPAVIDLTPAALTILMPAEAASRRHG